MTFDLWTLMVGSQVELDEGVIAEVQAPTEDGQWVKVKYIQAPQDPEVVGADDLCSADEITRPYEALPISHSHSMSLIINTKTVKNTTHIPSHRSLVDEDCVGDLLVTPPIGHHLQYLQLA